MSGGGSSEREKERSIGLVINLEGGRTAADDVFEEERDGSCWFCGGAEEFLWCSYKFNCCKFYIKKNLL